MFDPYPDNEYNRTIRKKEIDSRLFEIRDNTIEVDKNAVVERYAETFCKPIAQMIVYSLEEYNSDIRRDKIEMAMCFVQDIPYGIPEYADHERHYGGVSTPPGILTNGYGDCDSKAILFAGITIYLIPADEFIFLNQPDHILSAVQESSEENETSVEFNRKTYLLAETAGPGKRMLGEKGNYYSNKYTAEPLDVNPPATFQFKTQISPQLPDSEINATAKDYLVIRNPSDRACRFQLSHDNIHWKQFNLQENDSGNYKFNTPMMIFLRVSDKASLVKTYRIATGNSYQLLFNNKKKLWELF